MRATCQPPRWPLAGPRQLWQAKRCPARPILPGDLDDGRGRHAALGLGVLRREPGVVGLEAGDEIARRSAARPGARTRR